MTEKVSLKKYVTRKEFKEHKKETDKTIKICMKIINKLEKELAKKSKSK